MCDTADDGVGISDSIPREFAATQSWTAYRGYFTADAYPEVRKLAEKYGDPDDLLREDWIPQIPGITSAGSCENHARNPGKSIYGQNA